MHTRKTVILLVFLTPILIIANALIWASATGKIEGTITDKDTGNPVAGASVAVVGTSKGAVTDLDGKYTIPNLEPGVYTMKITHREYCTLEVTNVKVIADITTLQSFALPRKTDKQNETCTVKGKQDKLDIHRVSNSKTITKEEITSLPVTSVKNLMNQSTRVRKTEDKKVFIGGNRAGEVTYITNRKRKNHAIPVPRISPDETSSYYPPAHGGNAIVNGEAYDAMFFKNYGVNPFVDTEDDHLSTFAIDVDDASFVMTRSYLNRGSLPPDEAVRVEEFVNHFDYNYPAPWEETFRVFLEGAESRFGKNCDLLRIGIKGREVRPENRKPANLVFVVDISGSMGRENRLGLVRKSLRLLLDELTYRDRVGIVVYGSTGRVILQPTGIRHKEDIIRAIEQLRPGGATNAEEGIRLGYEMADRYFERGKINRIILCSDGVANVGRTGPDEILKMIKRYAEKGITLTTVGFGMGNYNDILMEKLGNKGNGQYAYVDNLAETKRIFVENLTGTLQVIARDVKIQVDFNPDVVRSYRLLGYENRDVTDNRFRDDKEDGGEIGAGHEVTALYEVKFYRNRPRGRVGVVFIRYKDPETNEVIEINKNIHAAVFANEFDECSPQFKLAAASAEFAEILRKSFWARGSKLEDVMTLVKEINMESDSKDVIELMSMISEAMQFKEQLALHE